MLWKRVIVAWMTLLALVFASAGASARSDVDAKPHVGAIDVMASNCIEAHGLASAGGHQENWVPVTTNTSDVPDAARGVGLGVKNTATALRTASEAYKGTTRLGHALSKHAGRNPSIWGKVTGNQTTWHGQALQHFRDILRGPGSF